MNRRYAGLLAGGVLYVVIGLVGLYAGWQALQAGDRGNAGVVILLSVIFLAGAVVIYRRLDDVRDS